jgi:hypothetical protein
LDTVRARVPLHGRLLVAIVASVPWMLCYGASLFSLFLSVVLGPLVLPVAALIAVSVGVPWAHCAVALTSAFVPEVSALSAPIVGVASAVGALVGFVLMGGALDGMVDQRHEALAYGAGAVLGSLLCAFVGTMARRVID